MKTTSRHRLMPLTLLALSTLNRQPSTGHAQGTAFTYQGRLNSGTNPANGTYDFVFEIYGSPCGASNGSLTKPIPRHLSVTACLP